MGWSRDRCLPRYDIESIVWMRRPQAGAEPLGHAEGTVIVEWPGPVDGLPRPTGIDRGLTGPGTGRPPGSALRSLPCKCYRSTVTNLRVKVLV